MELEQEQKREKKAKDIPWGKHLVNTARRTREALIKGDGEREVHRMGEQLGSAVLRKENL